MRTHVALEGVLIRAQLCVSNAAIARWSALRREPGIADSWWIIEILRHVVRTATPSLPSHSSVMSRSQYCQITSTGHTKTILTPTGGSSNNNSRSTAAGVTLPPAVSCDHDLTRLLPTDDFRLYQWWRDNRCSRSVEGSSSSMTWVRELRL
ncbi:hypothetical protein J6590_028814 [Homalodisca vitripennis]|nr:hypothetical protein J6590_028814 [Homalodisca vitripennis]